MRILISLLSFCLISFLSVTGQVLEDFEDETTGSNTFTSAGESFTVSGGMTTYDVNYLVDGGWNGTAKDDKFIDNLGSISNENNGTQFNIINSTNINFYVNDLSLFCSTRDFNLNHNGTLTLIGVRNNVTQFSIIMSSGFNTNINVANGYTFIDFATAGASDFSIIPIDKLVFSTTSDLVYLKFDAFNWTSITPLPIELLDFEGRLINSNVKLTWLIGNERNNDKFIVEHSSSGIDFFSIAEVKGKLNSTTTSTYSFLHSKPNVGNNYYRLKQIDLDGNYSYSKIIEVIRKEENQIIIYPNPHLKLKSVRRTYKYHYNA